MDYLRQLKKTPWIAGLILGSAVLLPRTARAVGNGDLDQGDQFPWVVKVPGCSGALITQRLVLTANHCITGSAAKFCGILGGAGSQGIGIASDVGTPFNIPLYGGVGINLTHTNALSGNIYVRRASQISSCSPYDSAIDMAVIVLDYAVPPASAGGVDAYHLPFRKDAPGYPGCFQWYGDDAFDVTEIGYGCVGSFGSDALGCNAPPNFRSFNFSNSWRKNEVCSGACSFTYRGKWNFPEETLALYDGPLFGDSGGPIIDRNFGALCGVSSRIGIPATSGPPLFRPQVEADYAPVDSADAIDFLVNTVHLTDHYGRFLGECGFGDGRPKASPDRSSTATRTTIFCLTGATRFRMTMTCSKSPSRSAGGPSPSPGKTQPTRPPAC